MATALTVYLTSTTDTLVTTSKQLSATAPAAETSFAGAKIVKSTGWFIIDPITQNATASTTEPAPNGHGWIYDSTLLEGQTIIAGNTSTGAAWTPNIKMAVSSAITGTIHVRMYKRSSSGVYTLITECTNNSGTIGTTATVYNLISQYPAAMPFSTGDKLYIDVLLNITTASGSTTATATVYFNGGANEQIQTPGYNPTTPDFTLTSPTNVSVAAGGGSASGTVTISAANSSTTQSVTMSSSGLPTGATLTWGTNPVVNPSQGGVTDTYTIGSGTAVSGTYTVTITGTSNATGTPTHNTTFTLSVIAPTPDQPPIQPGTDASIVQTISGHNVAGTYTFTLNNCTIGNMVVAIIGVNGSLVDPTESGWIKDNNNSSTNYLIQYSKIVTSSTVTCTVNMNGPGAWVMSEFFGILTFGNVSGSLSNGTFSGGNGGSGTTANPAISSNATMYHYVIDIVSCFYVGSVAITQPPGYLNCGNINSTDGSISVSFLPKMAASQATTSVAFTAVAGTWLTGRVEYRVAGYPQITNYLKVGIASTGATNTSITPTYTPIKGSLQIIGCYSSSATTTSVVSSGSSSSLPFTKLREDAMTGGGYVSIWYARTPSADVAPPTITATYSASSTGLLHFYEGWSIDTTTPFGTATMNKSTTAGTTASGSIATTVIDQPVVVSLSNNTYTNAPAPSGFYNLVNGGNGNTVNLNVYASTTFGNPQTINFSETVTSTQWIVTMLPFIPATATAAVVAALRRTLLGVGV